MMANEKKRKSDRQTNNALSLERMINNTKENIKEAEISMEFADTEEHDNLEEKNAHRKRSIFQMEEQLKEKAAFEARKDRFQ